MNSSRPSSELFLFWIVVTLVRCSHSFIAWGIEKGINEQTRSLLARVLLLVEPPAVRGPLVLTNLVFIQVCIGLVCARGVITTLILLFSTTGYGDILLQHRRILLVLSRLADGIAAERLEAGWLRLLRSAAAYDLHRDIVVC